MSGAGPLLSLASLKEYGTNFKPDFVIYLYTEANDMGDLKNEKETFLINYLDDFSQNLINRNDEINLLVVGGSQGAKLFDNKLKNNNS